MSEAMSEREMQIAGSQCDRGCRGRPRTRRTGGRVSHEWRRYHCHYHLATIVIAVAVYLLHWLYRHSSKDISFVRTGLGGEKVVIGGGAFVLPIVHDVTEVSMNTLRIEVRRGGEHSLITKDRMRVEVTSNSFCA